MTKLLPNSVHEALNMFHDDDTKKDCHQHCTCWLEGGVCCECDEGPDVAPIPVKEFFESSATMEPDASAHEDSEPLILDTEDILGIDY